MSRTAGGRRPGSHGQELADLLRAQWEPRRNTITMRNLAGQLGMSHATVSRWFSGAVVPDVEQVSAVLTHLGVAGEAKERILNVAHHTATQISANRRAPRAPSQLARVLKLERAARSAIEWSPLLIPELLRTDSYARAAIVGKDPTLSAADVDHLVTLLLGRQNAIVRDKPIQLEAFIGVPAVSGRIGGKTIMVEQLRHLLKASRFKAVTLRLVPTEADWHGGLLGPFVLYETSGSSSSVRIDHYRTATFIHDSSIAEEYKDLASKLDELAMTPEQSREFIQSRIREW